MIMIYNNANAERAEKGLPLTTAYADEYEFEETGHYSNIVVVTSDLEMTPEKFKHDMITCHIFGMDILHTETPERRPVSELNPSEFAKLIETMNCKLNSVNIRVVLVG